MKIESYKTVSAASAQDLDEEVNDLIKQGFQPYGDPYFVPPESQGLMAADISPSNQAMVKFDDSCHAEALDAFQTFRSHPSAARRCELNLVRLSAPQN